VHSTEQSERKIKAFSTPPDGFSVPSDFQEYEKHTFTVSADPGRFHLPRLGLNIYCILLRAMAYITHSEVA